MNILRSMYSKVQSSPAESTKNPNRVTGGIKGSGTDSYTMLGEDGREHQLPTHKYVSSLEQQLRIQSQRVAALEKRCKSLENNLRNIPNS